MTQPHKPDERAKRPARNPSPNTDHRRRPRGPVSGGDDVAPMTCLTDEEALRRALEHEIARAARVGRGPDLPPASLDAVFLRRRVVRTFPTPAPLGSRAPVPDVLRAPHLRLDPMEKRHLPPWTRDDWEDVRQSWDRFVLLGRPGSGKSTLLAWETLTRGREWLAHRPNRDEASPRYPVPIRMADLAFDFDDEDAAGDGPHGAAEAAIARGERCVERIARVVAERLASEPAEVLATLRRALHATFAAGRVLMLIDDFDASSGERALARRRLFERNLRALLAAHPRTALVLASRYGRCTAPRLADRGWRVLELEDLEHDAARRLAERFFTDLPSCSAGASRRLWSVLDTTNHEDDVAREPRFLWLLCAAAVDRDGGTLAMLRRAAELLIETAPSPGQARRDDVEALLDVAGRIALALDERARTSFTVREAAALLASDGAPIARRELAASFCTLEQVGIVVPDRRSVKRRTLAHRPLAEALAASALAKRTGAVRALRARAATGFEQRGFVALASGALPRTGPDRAEVLVRKLLRDASRRRSEALLLTAAFCAGEVRALERDVLHELVAHVLDRCRAVILGGEDSSPGESLELHDGSPFPIRSEHAVGVASSVAGVLFRTHASSPELQPLRALLLKLVAHPDPSVRQRAVGTCATAAQHDQRVRRALVERLRFRVERDHDVRSVAVHAIAPIAERNRLLREVLVAALDPAAEKDAGLRAAAAYVVAGLARDDADLQRVLARTIDRRRERSADVRSAALRELSVSTTMHDELREALLRVLRSDPDDAVRSRAARLLERATPSARLVAALRRALEQERSDGVRAAAAIALRWSVKRRPEVRDALIRRSEARREPDAEVRSAAVVALGLTHNDPRARAALLAACDAAREPDPEVRRQAVFMLTEEGGCTDRATRQAFYAGTFAEREPEDQVRAAFLSALIRATPRRSSLRDHLIAKLDDPGEREWQTRRAAILGLGPLARSDRVARDALLRFASVACSHEIGLRAVALSGAVDDFAVRRALVRALSTTEEPLARVAIAHALSHARRDAADLRRRLASRLNVRCESATEVRVAIVRALDRLTDPARRPPRRLVGATDPAHEPSGAVRAAASDVLRRAGWRPQQPRPRHRTGAGDDHLGMADRMPEFFASLDCTACWARRRATFMR